MLIARLRGMQQRLGREVRARQAALVRRDGYADLERIACPSLVVACRQDRLRSFAETERMAQHLPHARFAVIEDCGHMAPLERPHELAALLALDRGSEAHMAICRLATDLVHTLGVTFGHERSASTVCSSAPIGGRRLRRRHRAAGREAPDHQLSRINVLDFARRHGLDEERTIAAFLHAARIGLFEHVVERAVPGLRRRARRQRHAEERARRANTIAPCAPPAYEPTLDEMVEVTLHRQPAHAPDRSARSATRCRIWEYYRQVFWGSGVDLPEDDLDEGDREDRRSTPSSCRPARRRILSLQLPAEFLIVFEPVTHAAQFIDVKGEPTSRAAEPDARLHTICARRPAPWSLRPGPLRLSLENRTDRRILPGIWIADDAMHDFIGKRRPFLTAKRLLSNQTFRDIYRTDTLDVDQRLKITSLTFLFTDLKGSTELYERVGDLVAFDLVREHFRVLNEIVAAEGGAVVKTIGDAVMATFPTPDRALAAALRMREAMRAPQRRRMAARTCCSRSASTKGLASP